MTMSGSTPPVCDYEGSDYQSRFWGQADRAYEDQAEAIALRRLLPAGRGRLLEVGAGAGRHTGRYRGYEQIVLLDYSRDQLMQAKARLGESSRLVYVEGDVYRLPFAPGAFGAATMIRVLHHMAEPQAALTQVRATLAAGAVFVLEYANKRNLKAILRWALGRQGWNPFDPEPVEFAPLHFDFHPEAVRTWLDNSQFQIEALLTVSHFRQAMLKRLIPLPWLVWLDSLAQHTGRWWQLSPSVFVRARAVGPQGGVPAGDLWRCPRCEWPQLHAEADGLRCPNCGRLWALRDGIYDFKRPSVAG